MIAVTAGCTLGGFEECDNRDGFLSGDRVVGRRDFEVVIDAVENDSPGGGTATKLAGGFDRTSIGSRDLSSDPVHPVSASARPIICNPARHRIACGESDRALKQNQSRNQDRKDQPANEAKHPNCPRARTMRLPLRSGRRDTHGFERAGRHSKA